MRPHRAVSLLVVAVLLCSLLVGPISFVGAAGKSATFETRSPGDDRGDVIPITVHASKAATVNIGSPDQGFWVQVNVTKGTTTLDLNTYRADDPNETISLRKGGIRGTPNVRIPSESGPLQPGVYDMNVMIGGVTQDIGSFTVEQRETGDAWTGVLPTPEAVNPDEFETPDDLRKAASATENGTVAKGDQFVLAVNVSGMSGFLHKSMLDGSGENVSVHFRETNAHRNTVPNEFDGDEATRMMLDDENDVLYLVLDTDEHDIEAGDAYDVAFEIGAENGLVTEPERATTTFSVEERRVALDYSGDVLVVEDQTRIGGTTNLAPGTTVNVTAYDTGKNSFFWPKTATVTEERTFGSTFDFGGVEPGTSFSIELRDQDRTVTGVVAARQTTSATTTTTTTVTTTTTEPTTTTMTETPTNTTTATTTTMALPPVETEQPITAQSVSEGDLPGFDVPVALVALVAGAVLVLRRTR
ncbi:BGTF surface domain-containing protein [Haladaptatus sp. DYF46]|uniref:BGTF surface domain-containing protein n=1 Tax=Haladaptatus sp. DYF46 TaxID=2886041 RepID=UPI001E44D4D1|nr:BGTF surface domain-containing protein [Haladaptatus sp. DYF46]